jgi:two-component system, chemotaxis family, response regulator Rcp1
VTDTLLRRVLLVEDNEADMRLVQEALAESHSPGDLPITLHWAPSGEAAMQFLRRASLDKQVPQVDLMLLDLNLPGLRGHDVLASMKSDAQLAHVPVVVLSSSTHSQDVMAAYRAHANAYWRKPTDFAEFVSLLKMLRTHWFGACVLPGQGG